MWVRIDDHAPSHPKLVRAGAEAGWLWLSGLCYSNAHQLDGRLDRDLIPALYPPLASKAKALSARLVRVGLWHDHEDHFEIHDYAIYQAEALKSAVEDHRRYERERKAAQRAAKRAHVPKPVPAVPPGHHPVSPAPGRSGRPDRSGEDLDRERGADLSGGARTRAGAKIPRRVLEPMPDQIETRSEILLHIFERVVHDGARVADEDDCLVVLGGMLAALDDRAPDEPEAFFERVLIAYLADKRARGKTPTVAWFAKDFAQWAQGELERASAPAKRAVDAEELRAQVLEHYRNGRQPPSSLENAAVDAGVSPTWLDEQRAVLNRKQLAEAAQ